MELDEFVELVRLMRAAQKLFSWEDTPRTRAAAKSLEREVDRVVEHETGPLVGLSLFDHVGVQRKDEGGRMKAEG